MGLIAPVGSQSTTGGAVSGGNVAFGRDDGGIGAYIDEYQGVGITHKVSDTITVAAALRWIRMQQFLVNTQMSRQVHHCQVGLKRQLKLCQYPLMWVQSLVLALEQVKTKLSIQMTTQLQVVTRLHLPQWA